MEAFLDEVSKLDELQLTTPATQLVLDNIKLLKSCHIQKLLQHMKISGKELYMFHAYELTEILQRNSLPEFFT